MPSSRMGRTSSLVGVCILIVTGLLLSRTSHGDAPPSPSSEDSSPPLLSIEPFEQYWRWRTSRFTLRVVGDDVGRSGLDFFVVSWTTGAGWWNTIRQDADDRDVTMSAYPGLTYEFTVWGQDRAGNRSEPVPARNPLVPYSWAGSGTVRDLRGYPVVDARLNVDPDPPIVATASDLGGWYRFLSAYGSQNGSEVWAMHPGYGAATARRVVNAGDSDTMGLRLTMPPSTSAVANGGFEQDLTGWRVTGTVGVSPDLFSGRASVRLGSGSGTPGARHAVSQTVTIPSDWHAPTLSFEVRLAGVNQGAGGVELLVDGVPMWQSFLHGGHDWQHVWIDLEGFQGQRVELTFRLTEAAAGRAEAWLDDVLLGEWWTPVVTSIDGRVNPGQPSPITIHGENFDPAAEVLLDWAPLGGVRWVDDETLTLTLPAQTPGFYDLMVRNPGGQLGGLMLPIGAPTFIPQIAR